MAPEPSNDHLDGQDRQSLLGDDQRVTLMPSADCDRESNSLLQDKSAHIPDFPPNLHVTLSSISTRAPPSTATPQSANTTTTTTTVTTNNNSSTEQEKNLLAHPEERRGDEHDLRTGGRPGEERGAKDAASPPGSQRRVRDLAAFWILGFCNNFTYWVMITAAYDLLTVQDQSHSKRHRPPPSTGLPLNASSDVTMHLAGWSNDSFVNTFQCHQHSTGAILVADTLPATAITLAAPLTLLVGVGVRVWVVSALCVASYLVLGLAKPSLVFLGVALASASRGFSDTTFLGYASRYHKHVLSLWSSGTGVATFVGPLLFSAMTMCGLHPRHVLLTFLVIPVLIIVSFWCVLLPPKATPKEADPESAESVVLVSAEDMEDRKQKMVAVIKENILLFGRAQRYLLPLAVFYLIMYFTNQGLLEMVYFPASQLSHAQQYSWSNTIRCFGTFISRSSHKLFLLPSLWLYCLFAVVIMAVVGTEAYYHYMPSEYMIFVLILVQGLLEGAVFRASVFRLHTKASDEEREFCLGIFPSSLFLPAMLAGFASIPAHDYLCQYHRYRQ